MAEQLVVFAPVPLVVPDLGLRAWLAVAAQDVPAALREVMMTATHALLLLFIHIGQALALLAPPPAFLTGSIFIDRDEVVGAAGQVVGAVVGAAGRVAGIKQDGALGAQLPVFLVRQHGDGWLKR